MNEEDTSRVITITVEVRVSSWGDPNAARKEAELKTESPITAHLPWESICAGLVQAALIQYDTNVAQSLRDEAKEGEDEDG